MNGYANAEGIDNAQTRKAVQIALFNHTTNDDSHEQLMNDANTRDLRQGENLSRI